MPEDIIQIYKADITDLQKKAKASADRLDTLEKKGKKATSSMKKGFEGVGKQVTKFAGAIAGAFAIQAVVSSAINIVKGFEKELSTLQSITGSTKDEMGFFADAARDVGKATTTSATEVVKAFTLVGSARPELLKSKGALVEVTEQALILAKAAGIDTVQAASALTNAMNQFGVSTFEAAKFTDILATSQQKGSSFINDTAEALKNSGSAARAAGLSFEDTNVAIQALAAGGFKGAEAGTKLRGILTKLAVQADNEINPSMVGLSAAVNELSDRNLTLAEATEIFGEENAAAALSLANQVGVVNELTGALNENGNALDQAETNMDNVDGAIDKLGNSWESLVLSIENGQGPISQFFKETITNIAGTLDSLSEANETLDQKIERNLERRTKTLVDNSKEFISEMEKAGTDAATTLSREIARLTRNVEQGQERGVDAASRAVEARALQALLQLQKSMNTTVEIVDEAITESVNSISALNAQLKEQKDLLDQAELGSAEHAKALAEVARLSDEVTIAKGGETEAMKAASKARDKAADDAEKLAQKEADALQKRAEAEEEFREAVIFRAQSDVEQENQLFQERIENAGINFETRMEVEGEQAEVVEQLEKEHQENLTAISKEESAKRIAIAEAEADADQMLKQAQIDAVGSLASALQGFTNEQGGLFKAALLLEKGAAVASIIINTQREIAAIAASNAILGPAGIALTATQTLTAKIRAATSLATIAATTIPQVFHEGEIDIRPGVKNRKGEFQATLMERESVINPQGTLKYRDELQAANNLTLDKLIQDKYVTPAIQKAVIEMENAKGMNLADNIANSLSLNASLDPLDIMRMNSKSKRNSMANAKYIVDGISSSNKDMARLIRLDQRRKF